jgi:hypothetical protein
MMVHSDGNPQRFRRLVLAAPPTNRLKHKNSQLPPRSLVDPRLGQAHNIEIGIDIWREADVSKAEGNCPRQFRLDLREPPQSPSDSVAHQSVLNFVDARTQGVRRYAIERVIQSGIFRLEGGALKKRDRP